MEKGTNDFYARYKELSPKPVKFKLYKEILVKFNELLMNCILEGAKPDLGHGLKTLSVIRCEADPRTMIVDWKTSNQLKQEILDRGGKLYDHATGEGEQWLAFRVQDIYFKFYWQKGICRIKNCTAYRFDATRGKDGNKTKLKALLKKDDLAYLRFRKA